MGIFDKWTKKATTTAVETATETFREKTNDIFGMIKIGLTATIIIFGGRQLIKPSLKHQQVYGNPQTHPQQPIVINNYYDRGWVPGGGKQQGKNHKKY